MKNDIITIAHGGGGIKTQNLINEIILEHLGNPILDKLDDSACINIPEVELAFSTDSYIVNPLFFPGGDIGKLAACGTINDLVMQGAEPRYMSMGMILEEGLSINDLNTIIQSMGTVLKENSVSIVTGDPKVVEQGNGNGIFINTTGIGIRYPTSEVHISNAQHGDDIIITGTIGDHGIAIMSRRQGLEFESSLQSDVAPLHKLIKPLLIEVPSSIHCLRDPTRGGIAAALCNIAEASGVGIRIKERSLPIKEEVRGACDLMGFDPLNVANEGKALIVCKESDSELILSMLRTYKLGKESCIIGKIVPEHNGIVILETFIGGERIVETYSGEDLPRIC